MFRKSLCLMVIAVACAPSKGKPDAQQGSSPANGDSIVLERSACFGTCPVYRLRLSGAGEVRFESRNSGDFGRIALDTVSAATFPSIISRARTIGFFQLPADIAADSALCRNRATDHETVVVSIFASDGGKRVEDYHGCFGTTGRDIAPQLGRLRAFEAEIDSVLNSSRWMRPASRR
jgi:hypothetical protein